MNHAVRTVLTAVFLVVVSLAGTSYAQSTRVIKVHIPFEFNVGSQTFPAGDYAVAEPLQHYFVLRDANGHNIAAGFTSGEAASQRVALPKLTFRVTGDQHTLTDVWKPDSDPAGQHLYWSDRSTAMAKRRSHEPVRTAEAGQP